MAATPLAGHAAAAAAGAAASHEPATTPPPHRQALGEPCVVLKVGEIVLKGGNRHHFERILQENIRRALRDLDVGVQLWNRNGVMVLRLTGQPGPGQHGPGEDGAATGESIPPDMSTSARPLIPTGRPPWPGAPPV